MIYVRFVPESGPLAGLTILSAPDPKRTSAVGRLAEPDEQAVKNQYFYRRLDVFSFSNLSSCRGDTFKAFDSAT